MHTNGLADAIQRQTSLSKEDAAPIANTVKLLPSTLDFDASHLLVHPPAKIPRDKTPFYHMALAAHDKALSQACSSLLAGPGSESDDTGDVAFWLGEGDFSKAENVLGALGLSGNTEEMETRADVNSITRLDDKYSFLIRGPESRVLFFLVGRAEGGWGGLVGAGDEIARLEALRVRLQKARQIPPSVLRNVRGPEKVAEAFLQLKEIGEVVGSDEVQKALSRARDSLEADGGGLGTEDRRQPKRKRSRAASPEGYVEEKHKGRSSLLPGCEEAAVTMEGLGEWARAYNASNAHKLRVRDGMLRLAMGDVMTVYMGIGRGDGGRVVVETIRAFGPREKGDGHGESRYAVYQQVTQQLHAMLEEEGLEKVKLQNSPPVVVSPNGIIHVLGYTPTEGERGVPITVRIDFHPDLADACVRLVVGTKAVPTKVKLFPTATYGRWQLSASAPPFDAADSDSGTKVLISVQALSKENTIIDSVTFGEFSYWSSANLPSSDRRQLPRLQIPDSNTNTTMTTMRRRANSHISIPSPTNSDHRSPFSKSPTTSTRLHRRMKTQSLMRTKQNPQDQDDMYAQTPILDLVTPLNSICVGWSQSELSAGRRLVRFAKVQDGRRLIVSCEPIMQDQYSENDSVISCIYRQENDSCYVTSVDVIYLLERLTNGEFPVEEKNRIRRNLEGLRPTTVSKHKPGFSDFFQRIMEFPDPKPRNIEKDLKVFEWNLLGQALEKILSKYSIYTSPPPESADSSPSDTPVSPESPELYALQLSYPPPDEPTPISRFLDQKVPKYPQLSEDYAIAPAADGGEPFPSPVDSVATSSSASSSSSAFPLFTGDHSAVENNAASAAEPHAAWTANGDYKPDMSLEHFNIISSYEVVDQNGANAGIHNFADNPGLDFNLYDNYAAFQGISDDTLTNLADPYM
ncbi:hypothetical protein CVT26_015698 [Gymnopilus dilepis]|uniref:DUF7082 domain-containing protein n=1 Tax=Gymnopilus dilepis TaxID=231916 RepID=A0A409VFG7_9AGAR|nr:hypothetical protein CVT26_015698 [Gymnopilus dilepis]